MRKLSTAIILLFIFITFTSCSKNVTLQVPKEEINATEESKETNIPKDSEVDSKEDTNSSIETPISNEETTSSEPITDRPALIEVIKEPIYHNSFGFINKIDLSSTPTIIIDEAEFYMYEEALSEAINDGNAYLKDNGTYALMNPYYIRNNYDILTEYPISDNCKFYLCSYLMPLYFGKEVPEFENSATLYEVNSVEFFGCVEFLKNNFNDNMKVCFEVEDGYVTEISHQYTP